MLLQISTLKFWINLEPLDYFRLIGTDKGGRSQLCNSDKMALSYLTMYERVIGGENLNAATPIMSETAVQLPWHDR